MIVELARDAPVVSVDYWAPHPCGGWYIEDNRVYGLPCAARNFSTAYLQPNPWKK